VRYLTPDDSGAGIAGNDPAGLSGWPSPSGLGIGPGQGELPGNVERSEVVDRPPIPE
jgi:hypothetical protein